ncbi:MAG: hypothetical protein K5657_03305 [Desulfovibrio sp.]|nr:hypothetical protein [Desulfovibrio sp.]
MHSLDPIFQQSVFMQSVNNCNDSIIIYASSDYDDSLASQMQLEYTASSKQNMQEQFRMIAQNLNDSGNIVYLFG